MKQRKKNRLHGYDYSKDNLYFITSVVHGRICCFGEIKSMGTNGNDGTDGMDVMNENARNARIVGTGRDLSLQQHHNQQIKIKSLSEIIGAYKTTVSKQIHMAGFKEFNWQRSFHDRIIRDDRAYENITEYINNNPIEWEMDRLYSKS
jgi:putative transposase